MSFVKKRSRQAGRLVEKRRKRIDMLAKEYRSKALKGRRRPIEQECETAMANSLQTTSRSAGQKERRNCERHRDRHHLKPVHSDETNS